MNAVTAFFVGQAMAGHDDSDELRALSKASRARKDLKEAMDALVEVADIGNEWRQYAGRLRLNLDARKLSESTRRVVSVSTTARD